MGEYHNNLTLEEAIKIYESIPAERMHGGKGIGFDLQDGDEDYSGEYELMRERLEDYIRQIKNPYCYLSNGVIVKISFAGRDTLEECLSRCIMSEKNYKNKKDVAKNQKLC